MAVPKINTIDPNQQDISDTSDDHFSSADEGSNPNRLSTGSQSPIPTTRVERVDDEPAHGEVPGTPAYAQRTQDAVPDEIEVVPAGTRSRSASRAGTPLSPGGGGGSPIPRTVVEKVDFEPSHGEVEGTEAKEMRMADAAPDEVRKAPAEARNGLEGRNAEPAEQDEEGRQEWFRSMWEGGGQEQGEAEDGFGDNDFDDFAEGGGDDDFGDFDEADDEQETPQPSQSQPTIIPSALPDILADLPPLDLTNPTTPSAIQEAITPYITAILPNSAPLSDLPASANRPLSAANSTPFLSDRSLSLWQQLVSPPPMQPPNWTRSRIRRLFLVSLGVPVDLDEILPPSKQKRLVLPSMHDERPETPALERLKSPNNDSTTSVDSKTKSSKKGTSGRFPVRPSTANNPPHPSFSPNTAMHLSSTTPEALSGFTDAELRDHVFTLEILVKQAAEVLEWWLRRRDEGRREKEALEGVVGNLVGFVKGRRGG